MRPTTSERARSRRTVVYDVCCGLGPSDRPYPERHDGWTIALVRRGTFAYRAHDARRARELRDGWLLLGRHSAEYECRHPTCGGDECTAIEIDAALLEDVRSATRLGGRELFPASVLPPVPRIAAELAIADRILRRGGSIDADALAMIAMEAILDACGAEPARAREPSARDRERVRAALDAIDDRPEAPWPLGELAALTGASPFHFARAFRTIVGTTPHRYVIAARVRRAAAMLLDTSRPVTQVAYDVGFGDLSNFIHTFRREIGATPRQLRARGASAHSSSTR